MKIFAFSGSLNSQNSMCNYSINKLIDSLVSLMGEEIEVFFIDPVKLNIQFNKGTGEEFFKGHQYIQDDMNILEKELAQSDLIIFASPIYVHGVSGYMKNFLDRIAYWTHLLRLIGKLGVTVSVCDTNGVETGTEYMTMFMQQLGCGVISNIEIKNGIQSKEAIDSIIRYEAKKIAKKINNEEFNIRENQREKFLVFKNMYLNTDEGNVEKQYWVKNDFFKYNSFDELFLDKFSL